MSILWQILFPLLFLLAWFDLMFFGKIIITYKIVDEGIVIRLFRLITIKNVHYRDISIIRKASIKDLFPPSPRTLLLPSHALGAYVLILKKSGFIKKIFISPTDPENFVNEIRGHLDIRQEVQTQIKVSKFRKVFIFLVAYIVAVIVVRLIIGQILSVDVNKYYQLSRYGVITSGVVVKVDCQDHDLYWYSFNVNGSEYNSLDTSENCPDIAIGENVQILYLPSNPEITTTDIPPTNRAQSDIVLEWVGAIIFPAFILLIISKKWFTK